MGSGNAGRHSCSERGESRQKAGNVRVIQEARMGPGQGSQAKPKLTAQQAAWFEVGAAQAEVQCQLQFDEYAKAKTKATRSIGSRSKRKFQLFDRNADRTVSEVDRIARSRALRVQVLAAYDEECAVCGNGLRDPNGGTELEAAHIVPRNLKGTDDVRNALALCRSHHWAFDRGLYGIDPRTHRIIVANESKAIPQNGTLRELDGRRIRQAKPAELAPHSDALTWHVEHMYIG